MDDEWDPCKWTEVGQPGFLLNTTEVWGQRILCCGGYLVHCLVTTSIASFYPVDASSTLPKLPPGSAKCQR